MKILAFLTGLRAPTPALAPVTSGSRKPAAGICPNGRLTPMGI